MPIRVTSKRAAVPPSETVSFGLPAPPPGTPQKPAGVSLCMIVKNEERFLEQCLRSVQGVVDEICIVDTGSSDRTLEIARAFGARIEVREWRNDFAWARNESLAMATKRWILMLDADEELKPESIAALNALKTVPAHTAGIWIRCYNKSDDYGGTGEMSHALVRVFPNNERVRFRGMIHEFVTLDGNTTGLAAVTAPIAIVHHGYLKEIVEGRNKAARNFEIVQAAAKADPTDPFAWFNVGSTAFLMNDYETARDALEKMRELNGRERRGFIANGYSILAETYCDKLGNPKKGEAISRGALEFSPQYANAHFQLGKALIAQQRFDEARAAFMDAIEDGKYAHMQFVVDDQVSIWKSHSEIGSSFVMQGDDVSAVAWFRKGLENAPGVQPLRLNLARALERLARYDEAHEVFRGVYDDFKDDYSTVDYVNFLLRRKDAAAALAVIAEIHDSLSEPMAVQLLIAASQIALQSGDRERALTDLEAGAARAPGNAEILNPLEALHRERGDDAAVQRLLSAEAATEPQSSADFVRRTYNANVATDFTRGLELARSGLERFPGDEHLRYNAAVAASSLGEIQEALAHLSVVLSAASPVYVAACMLRANIMRAKGAIDEAFDAVESVLAVAPANAEALQLKADLAEATGDLVFAETALRRIGEFDPQRGAVALAAFLLRHGRFEEAARIAQAAITQ